MSSYYDDADYEYVTDRLIKITTSNGDIHYLDATYVVDIVIYAEK